MKKKTLFEAFERVKDSLMVVYRSERYGLIWAGQVKFFRNALTYEAWHKTDFTISQREDGTVVVTVP